MKRKLTEIKGKYLITKAGKLVGKIDKLYFSKNLKKVTYISVEEGGYLPFSQIERDGENAIFVKSKKLSYENSPKYLLCEKLVFSESGEMIGKISDCNINFETGAVEEILLENGEQLNKDNIIKNEEIIIISNNINKEVKEKDIYPKKVVANKNVLINRVMNKDILFPDGNKLKKGEKVDLKSIQLAVKYDKIVELIASSVG